MSYAVEMASGGMAYIPSFIEIDDQMLLGVIHIQSHRQPDDLISLLLSFHNKVSRLKIRGFLNISSCDYVSYDLWTVRFLGVRFFSFNVDRICI
jgi:hypothetical protein